jgi:hypothetical protein
MNHNAVIKRPNETANLESGRRKGCPSSGTVAEIGLRGQHLRPDLPTILQSSWNVRVSLGIMVIIQGVVNTFH